MHQMGNKKNYIYLFFELVAADHNGNSAPDTKYYKCWHGARQIFKVSKAMKYSVKSTFLFFEQVNDLLIVRF